MNRNEAINFLKELLRNNTNMSPETISFEQPAGCLGFTVRIKDALNETDKETVRRIAKKYSLAVREEEDQVLIFKPN